MHTGEPDEASTLGLDGRPVKFPGDNPDDMATYLADHMTWYMEWPHVDDTFVAVYRSRPGYAGRSY